MSVSGTQLNIGESAVTNRAKAILHSTDEGMAWQESPSLVLLIPRCFSYAVIFTALALVCMGAHSLVLKAAAVAAPTPTPVAASSPKAAPQHARKGSHAKSDQAESAPASGSAESPSASPSAQTLDPSQDPTVAFADSIIYKLLLGVALFCVLDLGVYILHLKTTHYSATSQRLFVEQGIFHTVNRPYELHILSNAVLAKSLLMRPFGVANLTIASPRIVLLGLRNASAVRDLLRTGGQLEAQRVDKIRWR
jgi:hypothetical protein